MGIDSTVPLTDCLFGKVQVGSTLSYQQPAKATVQHFHADAPSPPLLPLDGYKLEPPDFPFVCTRKQQLHLQSLEVTLEMCRQIEGATRKQSLCPEWHNLRRPRVTASRFREVCQVGEAYKEILADRILKGTHQTAAMKRGLELEADAIWEYCQTKRVNHYPCGFVVHPDAPWLGASPDGLVFDPEEEEAQFGLIEMKCPNVASYVDCPYLKANNGTMQLKVTHAYYWQVQGQLLITGMSWCDFVVSAQNDVFIQRIFRDDTVIATIKRKVDIFYFDVYVNRCINVS